MSLSETKTPSAQLMRPKKNVYMYGTCSSLIATSTSAGFFLCFTHHPRRAPSGTRRSSRDFAARSCGRPRDVASSLGASKENVILEIFFSYSFECRAPVKVLTFAVTSFSSMTLKCRLLNTFAVRSTSKPDPWRDISPSPSMLTIKQIPRGLLSILYAFFCTEIHQVSPINIKV